VTTRTRRLARSLAAGLLAGTFGLAVPAVAFADDDSDSDRHHHRHRKHHHRRHQAYYTPHYGHYGYSHSYGPSCGDHVAYYCGPCSHHFASLNDLHHHVHHHHHVPTWRLPHVVIQASVGWVFGGY
jgi:hypothetical protein